MRFIKKLFEFEDRRSTVIQLVPLGDLHIGNRYFQPELLEQTIQYVEETPNAYVIGMGDYAECINAKDPRHDYNVIDISYMTPDRQYRKVTHELARIKDKIIVFLDGNHDYNFWKRHNHNYVEKLAYDLKVPYGGISSYLRLQFKRKAGKSRQINAFNIYAHHGWSGARTDAYNVKVIQDLSVIFPGLHLYLMGHSHRIGDALPRVHLYVDKSGQIREWIQRFVFTGSYLKGYAEGIGSYVEGRAYKPNALGSPVIEIKPNRIEKGYKDKMKPPFSIRVSTFDFITENIERD